MPTSKLKKIGFILVDGFSLMSFSSAVEPLRAANHLENTTLYDITFIPSNGERAQASVGVICEGKPFKQNGYDFDIVFVVAAEIPAKFDNPELFEYLKLLASKRVSLGGISGGPVVLARAGLMTNRRFTVHWDHHAALLEMDPDFLLERSLYAIDRNRYTCAGGVAPLDMMSAIISSDFGSDLAKRVNDWFIYTSVRAATDPQRIGLAEKYQVHHPAVLYAIELMENHLADLLSSKQIAKLSGIGERQMSRLFQRYLGKKPTEFYRDLRMERAYTLTLQSALPIIEIALATGYDNAAYFSKKFREKYGSTPMELRKSKTR